MGKIIRYFLAFLVLVAFVIAAMLFKLRPQYQGVAKGMPLKEEVEVCFDSYGVPHIYAQSAHDAYAALGYVHAQDRLFQMELLRRAGGGRLSGIFGPDLLPVDRFFRTLGTHRKAKYEAERMMARKDEGFVKAAEAYLKGLNRFMAEGTIPLEFRLNGIERQPWTMEDMFCVAGAMSFNFVKAFSTDPWLQHVYDRLGPAYLADIDVRTPEGSKAIPVYPDTLSFDFDDILPDSVMDNPDVQDVMAILFDKAIHPLYGSNSWVIGPENTEDGTTLFANDTHIGYAQPCSWYEAHLEYPGTRLYGNFMGGIPVALIGHNHTSAWGLTMWLNDDMDLFCEELDSDSSAYRFRGQWRPIVTFEDTIQVKGEDPVVHRSRATHHGPIMNDFIAFKDSADVLSMYWTFLDTDCDLLEAFYRLNHAKDMVTAREAVSMISSPGLNVSYGDSHGDIALWAAGSMVRRPSHVDPGLFLDGVSGRDEYLGYHDWTYNPKVENPPWGFVHSANNQHMSYDSTLYPGYYEPDYRAERIGEKLAARTDWSIEAMKRLIMDDESPRQAQLAGDLVNYIRDIQDVQWNDVERGAFRSLKEWDGRHHVEDVGPLLYYNWVYHILEEAMVDEMGEEAFQQFLTTNMVKTSFQKIICNRSSIWWDDIETEGVVEDIEQSLVKAFRTSVEKLSAAHGTEPESWDWGKGHQTLHKHAFHDVPLIGPMLSVGPLPSPGSIETVNNSMFDLTDSAVIMSHYGPQMRILIDMNDIENSQSILPTGQSGIVVSPHYKDQAEMYISGDFRPQHMNAERIEKESTLLRLLP